MQTAWYITTWGIGRMTTMDAELKIMPHKSSYAEEETNHTARHLWTSRPHFTTIEFTSRQAIPGVYTYTAIIRVKKRGQLRYRHRVKSVAGSK